MQPVSLAMNPEKLYLEPKLLGYVIFLCLIVMGLFLIEIPGLQYLMEHSVVRDLRVE